MSVSTKNFLDLLPHDERINLLSSCKQVELVLTAVLDDANTPTRHVYFPIDGFVSLIAVVDHEPVIEVGMVGREGMVGSSVALGIRTSPVRSTVQGRGTAWRIGVTDFQSELKRSGALRQTVHHYIYLNLVQFAQSGACLNTHVIAQRLARWLLMTQDRAHADEFAITQEFLAYMLGARRESITKAAIAFQKSGFIRYSRGHLTVLDRKGLEAEACSCYASDRTSYIRVMQ